jgi:hypothetical protein
MTIPAWGLKLRHGLNGILSTGEEPGSEAVEANLIGPFEEFFAGNGFIRITDAQSEVLFSSVKPFKTAFISVMINQEKDRLRLVALTRESLGRTSGNSCLQIGYVINGLSARSNGASSEAKIDFGILFGSPRINEPVPIDSPLCFPDIAGLFRQVMELKVG